MNKREQKTQAIIDTAFNVWSNSFFYNTSLSSLADALGMSKPAIYRYFKNKDALLLAMKDDFISKYQSLLEKSKPIKESGLENFLMVYIEGPVRFFAENYQYYRFFVLQLLNMSQDVELLFKEMNGEKENFLDPGILVHYGFTETEAQSISGFILSVAGFLLNQTLFTKSLFTKKEIDQMLKAIRVIVLYGLAGKKDRNTGIDYTEIERISRIEKNDVLPFNKIFTAVAEVIADKGIWNTTVDAIAEHLDMSKSSLYFYFDNKEQMIKDVIGSERDRLNELIVERIVKFESYEEQLYCIFYVMSSYFLLKPSIFTIMNWLRYQFLTKSTKPVDHKLEEFSEYINLLTKTSSFNPIGFPAELIAEGLSFILIHGLWECIEKNNSRENLKLRIRNIHQLLLYGLKGNLK
ncbi:MAG: TetR/AcrR family transcriptional regulator [Spirochaetia bacterium]|jgi:AcrR family transcriptional regulator|nr:TetR/AcrR family transcriptional regulator [Spirochaetia bacterium]